ncbi:MAG: hypothetical protein ACPGID_13725 [Rubricella sp.]
MRLPILLGAGALALAACAPPPEDACAAANAEITLGTLLSNTTSGTYDACLDEQRRELALLRLEATRLEAEAGRLRGEAAAQSAEQARLTRRLADANARQAELARTLAAAEGQLAGEEAELNALLERENALRESIESGNEGAPPSDDELRRIEAEQDSIRGILDALMAE